MEIRTSHLISCLPQKFASLSRIRTRIAPLATLAELSETRWIILDIFFSQKSSSSPLAASQSTNGKRPASNRLPDFLVSNLVAGQSGNDEREFCRDKPRNRKSGGKKSSIPPVQNRNNLYFRRSIRFLVLTLVHWTKTAKCAFWAFFDSLGPLCNLYSMVFFLHPC